MPRARAIPAADPICAQAVGLARLAALEEGGEGAVGDHLNAAADGERTVTHAFVCLNPGYRGWHWSVTVARASRSRQATVSEVVLIPGADAILAPRWIPWTDRLRAGDLAVGLLATTDPDDPRLAPGWSGEEELVGLLDDPPLHPVNWEPSLARPRVLSEEGRRDAASRWYGGEHGPHSSMAKAAPGRCRTCGWLLLIGGPLGQLFGVCAHLLSPSDGRIVSYDHGCGAHSEAQPEQAHHRRIESMVDDFASDSLDFGHS